MEQAKEQVVGSKGCRGAGMEAGREEKSSQKSRQWIEEQAEEQEEGVIILLVKLRIQPTRSLKYGFFSGLGICSFQKNGTIFAFFSVLYKRTERSLRSVPYFIKERNDLCVL